MAAIEVHIKGQNSPVTVMLDRVPGPGEYVKWPNGLYRVVATVLLAQHPTLQATIFVTRDVDGWPDEWKQLFSPG